MRYRVGPAGCGVETVSLNGAPLPFERELNPYRLGGAIVSMSVVRPRLAAQANELLVRVG